MATIATPQLKKLAADWEKLYKSAEFSGIVGDAAHALRGGYHISRQDQGAQNYSVTRPDDRLGRGDAAAAIDMTLNESDMVLCTNRLIALFADKSDPRRQYLNAFNGWVGSGSAKRYDIVANRVGTATSDHRSHVHAEVRRRYTESTIAINAIHSGLKGESKAAYLASIGVRATPAVSVATRPPAYPGRVLRRNDKQVRPDAAVLAFQRRMIARGWTSLGRADGYFGVKLENAVKLFQKKSGVTPDGVIGPKTWPLPWTKTV